MGEYGERKGTHVLLGYDVDLDSPAKKLHAAKICGEWEVLSDSVSQPGNRINPVRNVRILRGLINHWGGEKRFWKYMAAPCNDLLGYADETNAWVRCGNDQVLIDVWNVEKFSAGCSRDATTWGALFGGSLLDLISPPTRLSFPIPEYKAVWETGDSALGGFSALKWETQKYIVYDLMDVLGEIDPKQRTIAISVVEQLESTIIITIWGESSKVLLLGTDNRNVLAWGAKGSPTKAHRRS